MHSIPLLTPFILAGLASTPATDADEALRQVRAVEQARIELVQRLAPCVVCVFPPGGHGGGGSGVIIDSEGYGLTNFHVVRGFADRRLGDGGLVDGQRYPLEVLGLDPTGDVAMFKLDVGRKLYPAPLGDSDALRIGDWTLAMGNPFMLAEDYRPTVTSGVVSGLHRYQKGSGRALVYTDCIQVDTSINPGNSGGPLFDLRGELVGINGRINVEERGRVNVGLGYAISMKQIRRFLPALRAGLIGYHGAQNFTVRDESAGVIVEQIRKDSNAYRAGVRVGDRVVRLDGHLLRSGNDLVNYIGTYPERWPVSFEIEREGRPSTIRFRLDRSPLPEGVRPPKSLLARLKREDPFRPNPRANARAAERALRMHMRSVGRPETLAALRELRWVGQRTIEGTDAEPAGALDRAESRRSPPPEPGLFSDPDQIEQAIRWSVLEGVDDVREAGWRVIGGDEIDGRIACVLSRRKDERLTYRVAVDDADGELLAIEFEIGGADHRYEYGDYRPVDGLSFPFERRLFIEGELRWREVYDQVAATVGGEPE